MKKEKKDIYYVDQEALEIYCKFILKLKEMDLEYIEGIHNIHHIKPRCFGLDNSSENLVVVIFEDHFESHELLAKAYPWHPGIQKAYTMMSHFNGMKCDKYLYAHAMRVWLASDEFKEGVRKSRETSKTTESRKKKSESAKKRAQTPEGIRARKATSKRMKERSKTKEGREQNRKGGLNSSTSFSSNGKIIGFKPDLSEVRKFESRMEAGIFINSTVDAAGSVINGGRTHSKGWIFRKFKQELYDKLLKRQKLNQPIKYEIKTCANVMCYQIILLEEI